MDEGETKPCENCKREIPCANFTTHAVHCARNIRVCAVCKEPVPLAELPAHHDSMHKLSPCAQCGERVCGADLEDHVRDSCAHTMKSCRFCALELRRGSLPAHERYCGARTERCEPCGEWVMHRYRQLHLDSNHGFIRLDEDPVPTENATKTTNVPKPSSSNSNSSKPDLNLPKANLNRPLTEMRYFPAKPECKTQNISDLAETSTSKPQNVPAVAPGTSRSQTQQATSIPNTRNSQNLSSNIANTTRSQINGQIPDSAGTVSQVNGTTSSIPDPGRQTHRPMTDRANINAQTNGRTTNPATNETDTNPVSGIGPCTSNSSGIANGLSSNSQLGAVPRAKRSNHQPQVNTPAAVPDKVNKNLWASRGAVKKRPAPPPPPPPDARRERSLHSALQRQHDEDARRSEQTAYNLSVGLPPVLSAAAKLDKLRKMDALQNRDTDDQDYKNILQGRVWRGAAPAPAGHVLGAAGDCAAPELAELQARRRALRGLQPMSADEFAARVGALRLDAPPDRFSQIKSSLRELRRGLNEVTAPYNSTASNDSTPNGEVRLPCEFCAELVPPDDLVQHQTGCRPDLTQYRPKSRSRTAPRPEPRPASPSPVIPCEFCAAPLPVYLIAEHQERCGGDADLLLPD